MPTLENATPLCHFILKFNKSHQFFFIFIQTFLKRKCEHGKKKKRKENKFLFYSEYIDDKIDYHGNHLVFEYMSYGEG